MLEKLKLNTRKRSWIAFFLIVVIIFIVNKFSPPKSPEEWIVLIFICIAIIVNTHPRSLEDIGPSILLIGTYLFCGLVIYSYFLQVNIPYTNLTADSNSIMAIFTVVIAIATIVSVNIYKKSFEMSRMPNLDFSLNSDFSVTVSNKSDYPARNVMVFLEIEDKSSKINKEKFFRVVKNYFNPLEGEVVYIKDKHSFDFEKDFVKKFNLIKEKSEYTDYHNYMVHNRKEIFTVKIKLTFYSDTNSKFPLPIIKNYRVTIDTERTEITEIKSINN